MFIKFIPCGTYEDDNRLDYLWVVHKAIERMGTHLALIGPAAYWQNVDAVVNSVRNSGSSHYDYIKTYHIDQNLVDVISKYPVSSLASNSTLIEGLEQEQPSSTNFGLTNQIVKIAKGHPKTHAFLAWKNSDALRNAATQCGLPIIYNEIGPLRPPSYKPTAYFDFGGVHSSTEAYDRWLKFSRQKNSVDLLTHENLLSLFSMLIGKVDESPSYRIGISLQSPSQESSSGFTNDQLIDLARKRFGDSILLRQHPSQDACLVQQYKYDVDTSFSTAEYLSKIGSLLTVNSGLALEALLLRRTVYALGDPPFKFMTCKWFDQLDVTSHLDITEKLNWYLFGYLIPFEFLFDRNYYLWRLTKPPEVEIYNMNRRYWLHD